MSPLDASFQNGLLPTPAGQSEKLRAMKLLKFRHVASLVMAAIAMVVIGSTAHAQVFTPAAAGVEINPDGILRVRTVDGRIDRERLDAAKRDLGADLARKSDLRKVSLNRLEAAIEEARLNGQEPDAAMRSMAGLTSVRYVFFYPESGDVVLAGPAEGFIEDPSGRVRGTESGLPTILLEDVVTALRAFPPASRGTSVISVSIDPTAEGLKRLNQVLARVGSNVRPGGEARLAELLKENLGLQTVSIRGIPASTHFAQVLVEADYRMKLIGIGLERLPNGMASYTERSMGSRTAANAMERWYFEPSYDSVTVSEDGLGMSLSGKGVRLVGAAEVVGADGQRSGRAGANRASQQFCDDFTNRFDEIASSVPVYAQLRNLMDLSIAAAFIQQQDYATQAGWDMSLLLDESRLPVETLTAPQQVETAVNAVWNGNTLLTPLGGGVIVQPKRAISAQFVKKDLRGELVKPRDEVAPSREASSSWWWD